MKLSDFRWVRSLSGALGLCLCLLFIGLTTAAAAQPMMTHGGASAAYAAAEKPPVIQVFKAAPMVLDTADSAAVYTFKVKRATNVRISEAGNDIKNIDNPSGATLNGTADGLPAGAIPTDDSGKFVALLIASNEGGSVQAELTLALGADLLSEKQTGPTDNRTGQRTPKWFEQISIPRTPGTAAPAIFSHNKPDFFKCPDNCKYCLKPDDAASHGFTQKCSDQRCYFSPDDKQNWYCYSEPQGWCCANQQVSQTTKSQCTNIGGYWSLNQYEAQQACQPSGYCCLNYQVYYPVTEDQCRQKGGSYWSTSQAEVTRQCQQPCYCCLRGQVYQTTQTQCTQSGGACYDSLSQAYEHCQSTCWCCVKGEVFQTTQDRCSASGGGCYSSQSQAAAACRQTTPGITSPYIK